MLNLVYDISAGCTSIVCQDVKGNMLHGACACALCQRAHLSYTSLLLNALTYTARNLDYSLPGLRNITVQVDYTRGGKVVFTATHFAGYVGVLSGMRPGGWCDLGRFSKTMT